MRYKDFTSEDFAEDTFFIRWVKDPDAEAEWFWNAFRLQCYGQLHSEGK